jgi:hypothetical protein
MQQVSISVDASLASRIIQRELNKLISGESASLLSGGAPALGAYWPGEGGYNAGLVRGENGAPDYYLIVPVLTQQLRAAWGGYEEECEGASRASDGLANTKALLADSVDHPAARLASEFNADGHNDFYLPARRELQVAEANVPELFEKAYHWSSSQSSADSAYLVDFGGGWLSYHDKSHERLVRPVRRKHF